MEDGLQDGRALNDLILRRRVSAVSKDGHIGAPWFETREDALLTMRKDYATRKNYAAAAVTTCAKSCSRFDCER
jgi:hypothetical protein